MAVEEEIRSQVEVLQEELGINGWKCGGPTTKNKPCENPIAGKKRVDIDGVCLKLLTAPHKPLELERRLEGLFEMIACRHHRSEAHRASRLEAWRDIESIAPSTMSRSLQMFTPIVARQSSSRRKFSKSEPEDSADEDSADEMDSKPTPLSRPNQSKSRPAGKQTIKEETDQSESKHCQGSVSCCKTASKYKVEGEFTLVECTKKQKAKTSRATIKLESDDFSSDSEVRLKSTVRLSCTQTISSPKTAKCRTVRCGTSPSSNVKVYDASATPQNIWHDIGKCARKPLGETDLKMGHVYAFTVAENPDLIKIGYTSRPIKQRMQEWKRYCHQTPIVLYPPKHTRADMIPHAHRVEALSHAELRAHRRTIDCSSCSRRHKEWFEVSREDALRVLRKWSAWIEEEPYQVRGLRSGENWHLAESWNKQFARPDGYLDLESVPIDR